LHCLTIRFAGELLIAVVALVRCVLTSQQLRRSAYWRRPYKVEACRRIVTYNNVTTWHTSSLRARQFFTPSSLPMQNDSDKYFQNFRRHDVQSNRQQRRNFPFCANYIHLLEGNMEADPSSFFFLIFLLLPLWSTGHSWNPFFHYSLLMYVVRQSAGRLGRRISPSQCRYLMQTDIHALREIRTHDASFRAGEDSVMS
jgi:hypothetical protein